MSYFVIINFVFLLLLLIIILLGVFGMAKISSPKRSNVLMRWRVFIQLGFVLFIVLFIVFNAYVSK